LAGTALERAADMNRMFTDDSVDAILCMRGGYGSPQILPLLDYQNIRKHPKLFIGYSDITAIHCALNQKCGLATIHGAMAAVEFLQEDPVSVQSLLRLVLKEALYHPPFGLFPPDEIEILTEGTASGELVGGNLSLIATLMGTPYELDTKGKILFLEEIHEEPYAVDRMLTQLKLAGKFEDAAGIVLGSWTDCGPCGDEKSFTVEEVLRLFFGSLDKPVIANIQSGHSTPNIALPLGVQVKMDTGRKLVSFEEAVARTG
jgi:muramoyltetrapeptide carboxypeptidase